MAFSIYKWPKEVRFGRNLITYSSRTELTEKIFQILHKENASMTLQEQKAHAATLVARFWKEQSRKSQGRKTHRPKQYHWAKTGQYAKEHRAALTAAEYGVKVRKRFRPGYADDYIATK